MPFGGELFKIFLKERENRLVAIATGRFVVKRKIARKKGEIRSTSAIAYARYDNFRPLSF